MTKVLLFIVVASLIVLAGLAIYDSYRSIQTSQGETGDIEQEEATQSQA